jgi:tetratricopeptide (TPR) repeat protein
MSFMRQRKFDAAIPYLERAVAANPEDVSGREVLVEAYAKEKRFADASRVSAGLADSRINDAPYWYNVGFLKQQQGDIKGAKAAYQKSLAINDKDIDTLTNLGMLQFRENEFDAAQRTFSKLVGLDPKSITHKLNLGASAAQNRDYAVAVANWKEVIKSDPNRTDLRLELANAQWEIGDYDGAYANFKLVAAKDKKNANAMNGIGLYFMQMEKYAQSEAAFRGSIEANPKFIPSYLNLAFTLERMKQKKKAIDILEMAQKIAPQDIEVKRALARMRNSG